MYFDKAGKINTEKALKLAYERGKALGIKEVAVASSKGDTAKKALEIFEGFKVVVVTYHCGFMEPFKVVMPASARKYLEDNGAVVVSATHALSGVERAIAKKFGGLYP
ncbi:MAG: pyruvate kinase alpha/beta domain-containing protein, partial [Desulfobacterales bacterium]|nr:pyruvate kinase alpha/beta domain-containing protein [Desulfobacterales bacterium]